MNLFLAVGKKLRSKTAARLSVAAGLFVASLVLFAGPAAACCTAVVCEFCISSSSNCVCGSSTPVCNVAGCNCNPQCGMNTYKFPVSCVFSTPCDGSAAARAKERFDEIDANHDGALSHDELWAWVAKEEGESWAAHLAKGELPAGTKDAKAAFQSEFNKMDTDHNGSVSPGEMDGSLAPKKK